MMFNLAALKDALPSAHAGKDPWSRMFNELPGRLRTHKLTGEI